jgi:hypothetical protein
MMQTNLYDLERVHEFVRGAGLTETVALPVQHADHLGQMVFAWRSAPRAVRPRVASF